MRLEDKVALITGGAAVIGKASAERFIQEGALVIICDVNEAAGVEPQMNFVKTALLYNR